MAGCRLSRVHEINSSAALVAFGDVDNHDGNGKPMTWEADDWQFNSASFHLNVKRKRKLKEEAMT